MKRLPIKSKRSLKSQKQRYNYSLNNKYKTKKKLKFYYISQTNRLIGLFSGLKYALFLKIIYKLNLIFLYNKILYNFLLYLYSYLLTKLKQSNLLNNFFKFIKYFFFKYNIVKSSFKVFKFTQLNYLINLNKLIVIKKLIYLNIFFYFYNLTLKVFLNNIYIYVNKNITEELLSLYDIININKVFFIFPKLIIKKYYNKNIYFNWNYLIF